MMQRPRSRFVLLIALSAVAACSSSENSGTRTEPTPAQALVARASQHLQAEEADEALVLLDSSIAMDSTNANAFKLRGNAWRRKNELDAAIRDYNKAISLDARDARYFNDRGFALLRQNKLTEAIRDFDSALVLNPKIGLAHANRGRTHFYLGNLQQAERDLTAEFAVDSTNIYLAIWLHFIRARLEHGDSAQLRSQMARLDTVSWPGPVARYFVGHITSDELLRLSAGHDSTTTTDQRCAWFFYSGENDLINGRKAAAIRNFEQAKAVCPQRFSEYSGAVAELKQLRKQ